MKTFLRKIFVLVAVLVATTTVLNLTPSLTPEVSATTCDYFLGMPSWNCNANLEPSNQTEIIDMIVMIAANIFTCITVAAAYLVLGYVIYGGYLYIFSSGDPGKAANGRKTLTRAFIGLAIVAAANIILTTIRVAFGASFTANCLNGAADGCIDEQTLVTNTIGWIIGVAGIVAAIFVVIGGISYITSAGDAGKLQKAKNTILYACIGLVIVGLSQLIVSFVSGIIRDSTSAPAAPEPETSLEVSLPSRLALAEFAKDNNQKGVL